MSKNVVFFLIILQNKVSRRFLARLSSRYKIIETIKKYLDKFFTNDQIHSSSCRSAANNSAMVCFNTFLGHKETT